jgi:hypothetical protein
MARRSVTVDILGNAAGIKRAAAEAEGSLVKLKGVASEALGEAGFGRVGRLAGLAGGVAAAGLALGALVSGIKSLTSAGLGAEASQARLAQSFKNAHVSLQANSAVLEKYLALQRSRGFTDTQTRDSLAREIVATRSATDAIRLNNLAADIARTRHIDLSAATRLAIQAFDGNTRVLKQLGIVVQPVTENVDKLRASTAKVTKEQLDQAKAADKVATANKIVNAVMQATHGQADTFAKTDAGKIAAFGAQWDHIKEVIGKAVLPVITSALQGIGKAIAWLQGEWDKYHRQIAAVTTEVWNGIKSYIQAVIAFWRAIWDKFGTYIVAYLKLVWNQIKTEIKVAFDIIKGIFKVVTDILSGNWSKAWDDIKSTVKNVLGDIWNLLENAVTTLGSVALKIGEGIAQGIVNGLSGVGSAVINLIVAPINAIIGGINTVMAGIAHHWPNFPGLPGPPGFLTQGIPKIPSVSLPTIDITGGGGGGTGGGPRGTTAAVQALLTAPLGGLKSAVQTTASGLLGSPAGLSPTAGTLGYGAGGGAGGGGGGGGTVKSKGGRAAKKGHGLDLKEAIAFATGQVGKRYQWGAGHGFGVHASYDCSGFAANVAARVKGPDGKYLYTGGFGRSEDIYRSCTAAKGDEPVLFGFMDFLSDGPGHMGIKLESTIYQAGDTATGVFSGPFVAGGGGGFTKWMIPAGMAGVDTLAQAPRAGAGTPMQAWMASAQGQAAVAALGQAEVSKLYRTGQLGQIPGLEARTTRDLRTALSKLVGAAVQPTAGAPPSAVASLQEKQARFVGETAAARAGVDPSKISLYGDAAVDAMKIKLLKDQATQVKSQFAKTKLDWQKAELAVQLILRNVPRKGRTTAAYRAKTLKDAAAAAKTRDALANKLSGLMAQLADLQAQADELNFDLGQVDLSIAGALPGQTTTPTTTTPTGPTPAEVAAGQLAAASESWLSVLAGPSGSIGQGGPTALGAASNMTFNIQALSPGDPAMLQQLARTVLSAISSQGSFVPASLGASGA